MSFLQMFAELASVAAEGIGAHQAQQQQQAPGARRTVRRKEGCTPCAAMKAVDVTRKELGFDMGKKK